MIVDDLDVERAPLVPAEADSPAFIDANSVLALPVSFLSFKAIAGWGCQVLQNSGPVQVQQFSPRRPLECSESARNFPYHVVL
jgi:hypothetical protein